MILNFFLFIFITFPALAADIQYQSRINIAEFKAKSVRNSWCIFSDGDSQTTSGQISSSGEGNEGSNLETFSHRGIQYLRRKVEWDSKQGDNGMVLSFNAEDANFDANQKYDKKTCTYKTWKAKSTSAEIVLKAQAAFLVPKNVWAIRITSRKNELRGVTGISLSNDEYVQENNKHVLKRKGFYNYNGDHEDRYFLVNPSHTEADNFIYLDFEYISKTLHKNGFDFTFNVEFISAEQCLTDLNGLNSTDLLHKKIKNNLYENALTNLSCMLNPQYIKHTLGIMHIQGLGNIFEELKDIEKTLTKEVSHNVSAKEMETLDIILKLLNRVRFYYSYEILKETMSMVLHNVNHQGKDIDSLLYLEVIRRRGVLYLFDIFANLLSSTSKLKEQEGPFLTIPDRERVKFDIVFNSLLNNEFKSFQKSHELIFQPKFLFSQSFTNLQSSVHNVLGQSDILLSTARKVLLSEEVLISQIETFESELLLMSDYLRFYASQMDNFKLSTNTDSPDDYLSARRELFNQMELIYQVNIVSLVTEFEEYFIRHFEDPIFQNIDLGKKQYTDPREFIADFKQLIEEVQ